ncbi:MAG: HAD family phosphatase [Saprospiraceae bacterium]
MPQYLALLSDLDGTLVDTEPQHADAWLAVLADLGLNYDHQWFEQWIGTSDRFLAASVIEEHDLDFSVRDLQTRKQVLYHQAAARSATVFPGVEPIFRAIAGRVPTAIATNSGRGDADAVFRATQLDLIAHATITADDVEHLKPAPDIYLAAAAALGVDPAACVAIEDSEAGSLAARAAGAYVLGLSLAPRHACREFFTDNVSAFKRAAELLGV